MFAILKSKSIMASDWNFDFNFLKFQFEKLKMSVGENYLFDWSNIWHTSKATGVPNLLEFTVVDIWKI